MPNRKSEPKPDKQIKLWKPDGDDYELLSAEGITHSMPRQVSDCYAFGVIEAGQATFSLRDTDYKLGRNSFLLLHPGEPFTRKGDTEHPRNVRMLLAKPDFLIKHIADITEQAKPELPKFEHSIESNPELVKRFLTIHRSLEHAHSKLERDVWLKEMVTLLLKHCEIETYEPELYATQSQRIKQVRLLLMKRFSENISLDELAAEANLSPHRLNRIFSQEVGMPPHAYLNLIRVWHAKKLLEQGVSIADAAVESGFYDQAHFTKHFKRINGFTPSTIKNHT
jgi:AraC-like DNA-binding protein